MDEKELLGLFKRSLSLAFDNIETAMDYYRSRSPLYIYGAGRSGKEVLQLLRKYDIAPDAFLDRAEHLRGTACKEIPILHPDRNDIPKTTRAKSHVLLAIPLSKSSREAIQRDLKDWGFTETSYAPPLVNPFAESGFVANWKEKALKIFDRFEDRISRICYAQNISATLMNDAAIGFAEQHPGAQYFPEDVPLSRQEMRFVDCGAYTGDTLQELMKHLRKIDAYAGFEPIPDNFKQLARVLGAHKDNIDTGVLLPVALGNAIGSVSFFSNGPASAIIDGGDGNVPLMRLDDTLRSFHPSFIKMDIEGAEYDSLLGGYEIIKENRPDLAVCVYHYLDNYWEIPLLIDSWNLGYKFFLRHHSTVWNEAVLYATAK